MGPLLEHGFTVTVAKNQNKVVHTDMMKRYRPVKDTRRLTKADVLISFDEPITNTVLNTVTPKIVVACKDSLKAIMVDYDWAAAKIKCFHYHIPEAKDIPIVIAMRKCDKAKDLLEKVMMRIGGMASPTTAIVKDVLPRKKRFLLHPTNGRSLFSCDRPAPELTKQQWPIVLKYKPSPSDISMDHHGAKSLDLQEVAMIHSVDPPPPGISRKDGFEAITKTVPIPIAKAITKSIRETIEFTT